MGRGKPGGAAEFPMPCGGGGLEGAASRLLLSAAPPWPALPTGDPTPGAVMVSSQEEPLMPPAAPLLRGGHDSVLGRRCPHYSLAINTPTPRTNSHTAPPPYPPRPGQATPASVGAEGGLSSPGRVPAASALLAPPRSDN
ncbi:hypothetical protein E2C01_047175 [Portunus trituberculatus]|uniref:Uncharacterized protein n=1 Tax=Portunus trituberculatus TaxID=210409 RepID=A0A5B7G720_PORTR|nr:hypothetical protein [Portunus trituberculatus]